MLLLLAEKSYQQDDARVVLRLLYKLMLPSKKRLARSDFGGFLASKDIKSVFNNLGTLKYKKSDKNQAAIIISSKVEKTAIFRNLARRRIYSLFRELFKNTNEEKQYILYVSKHVSLLNFDQIKSLFYELLKKTTK